jgi:uncharacterized protein
VLLAVFLAAPDQGRASVAFTLDSLWQIAPYLVVSIALAAAAKAAGADNLIANAFTGRPVTMIVLAAAFGALSPFCSCGVIPLIAALLAMGVPLGPVMAFWLASPVIDPSMFVLTAGMLGLQFAVAKTMAAIAIGLFGGLATHALTTRGASASRCARGSATAAAPGRKSGRPSRSCGASGRRPGAAASSGTMPRPTRLFLGKWLALAFVLESLMVAYLPESLIIRTVGGEGWASVATATLVGIPAYLNGYAALPLVSGLIGQGMAPGAGLAFLVAGGITSIPPPWRCSPSPAGRCSSPMSASPSSARSPPGWCTGLWFEAAAPTPTLPHKWGGRCASAPLPLGGRGPGVGPPGG